MTLLELLRIMRVKLSLIIVLSLAGMIVCGVGAKILITPTYTASATLLTNISISVATGFADGAANVSSSDATHVSTSTSTSSATITFTAEGADRESCVSAANEAADITRTQISTNYEKSLVTVREAESAQSATRSPKVYAAVGLVAGFAVAVVIAILWDERVRRVHSWSTVETNSEVRYLGSMGGDEAQRDQLSTAVHMASHTGGDKEVIYLVPVGATTLAPVAARQLKVTTDKRLKAAKAAGREEPVLPQVVVTDNLDVLVDEQRSYCVLLVVEQEVSTYRDLGTILNTLDIAHIVPTGFIYADSRVAKEVAAEPAELTEPTEKAEKTAKTVAANVDKPSRKPAASKAESEPAVEESKEIESEEEVAPKSASGKPSETKKSASEQPRKTSKPATRQPRTTNKSSK